MYDLTQYEHCPDDVLVLGTDGLWDVTNDKEVAEVVMDVLMGYEPNDPCRSVMAGGWGAACPVPPRVLVRGLAGKSSAVKSGQGGGQGTSSCPGEGCGTGVPSLRQLPRLQYPTVMPVPPSTSPSGSFPSRQGWL